MGYWACVWKVGDGMKSGMRPISYDQLDRKNCRFELRLSERDSAMLEYLSESTSKTKTEILREGLKKQFNLARSVRT